MPRAHLSLISRALLVPAVLSLSTLTLSVSPLAPSAYAQSGDVFSDGALVELLPVGKIDGDGKTNISMHVLALNSDGTPMSATKLKLSASSGAVSDPELGDDGLIRFAFTPPQVSGATDVRITLKGKDSDGQNFEKEWTVNANPALPTAMAVNANPTEIVLGQDPSATLNIQLSGGANQPQVGASLDIRAMAGTITNVTHLGSGQFSCLYTPPAVNYPHLDVLTIVDERSPGTLYGSFVIKLVGNTSFPVQSTANGTVMLKIGEREFGPFTTDAAGRVTVPITVPPGVREASMTTIAGGTTNSTVLDLKIPSTRRLNFFPVPAGLPADGLAPIPVRVAVSAPTGEPDTEAGVNFTTTAGTISEARHEGGGVYVADFTPPVMGAASKATLQVSLTGEPGVQSDSMEIDLIPTRPLSVTLTPDPAVMPEGATGFKVQAKVLGPDGAGLAGRELRFVANGARVQGRPTDMGNGDYEVRFATTGDNHVEVTGTAVAASTGNPVRGLLLLPTDDRVAPDGLSSAMMTVVAVDEFGYPVAGVEVALKVTRGDGTVPGKVTTDDVGIAQVYYTAGRANGLVTISASAGDQHGSAALLQVPAGALAGVALPASGSEWSRGLDASWRGIVTNMTIGREGAEGAQVATQTATRAAEPASSGKVETIALTVSPSEIAAGGSVTITVNALNGRGQGVSGQAPEIVVVPGTISTVQDNGDGTYTAQLTAPQGTSGQITVVATSKDGTISEVLKVPISAASAWGAPPAATPAEPAATPAPGAATPAAPKDPLARPWLRARVGPTLGLYNYSQTTLEPEDGPLWSQNITLGESAGLIGGGLDAAAWLPMFTYVGAELEARMGYYATQWPNEANTVVSDIVPHVAVNAMGRYPFDVGSSTFHVGVKVGGMYGDFITYRKGETDTQLQYEPLGLWGLGLGAEVQAEIGDSLYLKGGLLEGLRGADLYSTNVEAEVGYTFTDNLYAALAYNFSTRSIDVLASPSLATIGTLSDTSNVFGLNLGYQR